MSTINLKLYNILKNDLKLSDAKAQEFAEAIKEEIVNDIHANSVEYKSVLREDFFNLEIRLGNKINDQFKWMFGIFITLALMIIGLYFKS